LDAPKPAAPTSKPTPPPVEKAEVKEEPKPKNVKELEIQSDIDLSSIMPDG